MATLSVEKDYIPSAKKPEQNKEERLIYRITEIFCIVDLFSDIFDNVGLVTNYTLECIFFKIKTFPLFDLIVNHIKQFKKNFYFRRLTLENNT